MRMMTCEFFFGYGKSKMPIFFWKKTIGHLEGGGGGGGGGQIIQ
jgi:hypothetical protein